MTEYRIVRAPLPAQTVQKMDSIIDTGRGGFSSREEFLREAVEAMVLEVLYADPEGSPLDRLDRTQAENRADAPIAGNAASESPQSGTVAALTTLGPPPACELLEDGAAVAEDAYQFGLHNRDYPSLWAARQLADLTQSSLIPASDFYRAVSQRAWAFGVRLSRFDKEAPMKLTALFPTNRAKPESAEGAFLNFAVGTHSALNGEVSAEGPLFAWNMCQLTARNDVWLIGLTPQGFELLQQLAPLSLDQPRDPELVDRFFTFLHQHGHGDWHGFGEVLTILSDGVTREELVERFSAAHPEWTETVAATNAAGYVARCREWSLLGTRQAERRYVLTDLGTHMLTTTWGGIT